MSRARYVETRLTSLVTMGKYGITLYPGERVR